MTSTPPKQFTEVNDSFTMTLQNCMAYSSADDKCFTDLQEAKFESYKIAVALPTKVYEDKYAETIRALHNSWGSDMGNYIFERALNDEPHTILRLETKHKADWSKPKLWDSKLQLITDRITVRGGSMVNVSVNFRATEYQGTRFMQQQVKQVQILKLADEDFSPFSAVDGGFVADTFDGADDVSSSTQF